MGYHSALIAKCGSRRLINLSDQLHVETQRYRLPALAGKMPTGTRDVAFEHRQIMDAALARDADTAQALLAAHYRRTAELIEAQMSPRSG
ncbi:FCD domain-containing protein [Bosea eneae]|uniref:FCD domain-containing protein n=1 Tax=Bosea eneae TaxID=151454 RepID=A0ABW0ISD0_9HYPH